MREVENFQYFFIMKKYEKGEDIIKNLLLKFRFSVEKIFYNIN